MTARAHSLTHGYPHGYNRRGYAHRTGARVQTPRMCTRKVTHATHARMDPYVYTRPVRTRAPVRLQAQRGLYPCGHPCGHPCAWACARFARAQARFPVHMSF